MNGQFTYIYPLFTSQMLVNLPYKTSILSGRYRSLAAKKRPPRSDTWPPPTSCGQFLERLKEVNQMATQVLRSLDQTLGVSKNHRFRSKKHRKKHPSRCRGLLLTGVWWHVAAQPRFHFCIWLVCNAFNWCNDVLPTILLEPHTSIDLFSSCTWELHRQAVHFQVLRTSSLLLSFHLLSSIDLHKT